MLIRLKRENIEKVEVNGRGTVRGGEMQIVRNDDKCR